VYPSLPQKQNWSPLWYKSFLPVFIVKMDGLLGIGEASVEGCHNGRPISRTCVPLSLLARGLSTHITNMYLESCIVSRRRRRRTRKGAGGGTKGEESGVYVFPARLFSNLNSCSPLLSSRLALFFPVCHCRTPHDYNNPTHAPSRHIHCTQYMVSCAPSWLFNEHAEA
jgi:hypothetical protein